MKKILFILMISFLPIFAFENLTKSNIDEKLKDKNVIIDFYATWCPPCKTVSKNLKKFEKMKPSNVEIYKIDIDEQRELMKEYNVRSIPTILFVKNGKVVSSKVGIQGVEELFMNTNLYLK